MAVGQALVVGCGTTSVEAIEARVEGKPGVAKVHGWQEPGDGLPFLIQVPVNLKVVMEADASTAEVLDVFEAYSDEIDDDVVGSVQVVLRGPARATLTTSAGFHASEAMVNDLVVARDDPTFARYRLELSNLGQALDVTLATGGFDEVVATVARYRKIEDVHQVTVRAGEFRLLVDDAVGEVELTENRVRLMREADERFRLHEVMVGYPNAMWLWVDAMDVQALRRLVEAHTDLGYTYVRAYR